jgi:hypothetical protein
MRWTLEKEEQEEEDECLFKAQSTAEQEVSVKSGGRCTLK